jgi:hypothetical protein
MKRDLKFYLSSCRLCLEYHRGKSTKQGYSRPISNKFTGPGQALSIDLTGEHPESQGHKYIFTAQNIFSKFPFLQPLRDKSAESVAKALMKVFLKAGFYS